MDSQEMHDLKLSKRKKIKDKTKSRKKVEALLNSENKTSDNKTQLSDLDPIAWAEKNYPGLTREKIAEMIEKAGF